MARPCHGFFAFELGRFAEVVRTAPEFLGAYPASRFASAVISYEQAALMGLAQRGEASTAQRERLNFVAKMRAEGKMTQEQFDAATKDILADGN